MQRFRQPFWLVTILALLWSAAASAADYPDFVTLVDLYGDYPDYHIDVEREQKRLLKHDVIVFLHPFYWYSTPALLKEWQDLVLEYGFAYGAKGTRLAGKIFFSALTAGGPEKAYKRRGYNHFTLRELLAPLEQTANLCGMVYLPPFALYASRRAYEEGRIGDHVAAFTGLLTALHEDRMPLAAAARHDLLNQATIRAAKSGETPARKEVPA